MWTCILITVSISILTLVQLQNAQRIHWFHWLLVPCQLAVLFSAILSRCIHNCLQNLPPKMGGKLLGWFRWNLAVKTILGSGSPLERSAPPQRPFCCLANLTSSSAMTERPHELGDFKKVQVNGGTDNHSLKGFSQVSLLLLTDPHHMVIK